MKKLLLPVSAVAIVSVLVIAGVGVFSRPYALHGSPIDPPSPAADFALNDQDGHPFRLSDQKGDVVLVFFGYTHCPDVCPTTLAQFKLTRDQLGSQADRVRFVFITVDPERDTPARMREFLDTLDPTIVGLSGSEADLTPVWHDYGVYRQKQPGGSAEDYSMDHSTQVYLVDTRGNLRLTYSQGFAAQDLAQDIRYLLQ